MQQETDNDPAEGPVLGPIAFAQPWEYELHFPRDPRAPGIARTTLRAVLGAHGLAQLVDRAELLTSELATNSVRHTRGPASVRLRWLHPVLRVSVSDTSPVFPLPLMGLPTWEGEHGRGLAILALLADHWGGCCLDESLFGASGKTIWFELRVDGEPPTPPPSEAAALAA
ncbi:ATP-binding protein [Streptomyces sp. NPDC003090]|uniref:ATP-binding protein n=1 Tax=Streptomyces sp. NPDC003090 TaxID=3154274 RepID=UPI0037FDEADB